MRIRLNQQIRSYNDYANFRVCGKEGQFIRVYYHVRSIQAWDNDCWPNKVIEERYHDNSSTDIIFVYDTSSTDISSTYILSTMTFLAEMEAGVMKRILYQLNLDYCK